MIDLGCSGVQLVEGPAGALELLVDAPATRPDGMALGVALVAHPQPLLGGNAGHKVPQFLARGLASAGWAVVRPNFRGVGRSTGVHDAGIGESADLLALVDLIRQQPVGQRLALFGFSFGAFVQAKVSRALADAGVPAWRTALAGMPFGEVDGGRRYDTPDGLVAALVVHGEADERVPLRAVLDWARPCAQPVTIVPGADHFFSGKLPVLRDLVLSHVRL
jgi:uncharacterized protein